MRTPLPALSLTALIWVTCGAVNAQGLVSQNSAIPTIQNWYSAEIGRGSRIYNGTEYAVLYPGVVDHQYLSSEWQPGTISFLGRKFDNLELRYDIVSDMVVLKYFNPDDGMQVAVKPAQQKIESFTLLSLQFVQLAPQVTGAPTSGFYELILDKEYQLYARHSKEKFIDKSRGAPVVGFQHKVKLYLAKDGEFMLIRNRGGLLKAFEDRKKELKSYARSINLIWKASPRRSAALLMSHYVDLKSGSQP